MNDHDPPVWNPNWVKFSNQYFTKSEVYKNIINKIRELPGNADCEFKFILDTTLVYVLDETDDFPQFGVEIRSLIDNSNDAIKLHNEAENFLYKSSIEDYNRNFAKYAKLGKLSISDYRIGITGHLETFSPEILLEIDKIFPLYYARFLIFKDLEIENFTKNSFAAFGKYSNSRWFEVVFDNCKFNHIPKGVFAPLTPSFFGFRKNTIQSTSSDLGFDGYSENCPLIIRENTIVCPPEKVEIERSTDSKTFILNNTPKIQIIQPMKSLESIDRLENLVDSDHKEGSKRILKSIREERDRG